ncbi:response regulator [Desulfoferrobacter suflitae]|uniref:response regulator n=1 Tax=Desulfoferrobacter suflitae TaxID=2865782 RepID=UPI0021643AF8|nr:response regulator [Desulfoferrobacter suflitae]MCK8600650.1 response regulator [Desulfoferrobacter suflitae]
MAKPLPMTIEDSAMGLILVVDDEKDAGRLMERVLSTSGHKVCAIADPDEAITWLQQNTPDLVLLDVKLKGRSGISVLEYLHGHEIQTKVVMVTGYSSPETRNKARQLGVQEYLSKPVEIDELESRINKLLEAG